MSIEDYHPTPIELTEHPVSHITCNLGLDDPPTLPGPVLDIGCGRHAKYVKYLRSLGVTGVMGVIDIFSRMEVLIHFAYLSRAFSII